MNQIPADQLTYSEAVDELNAIVTELDRGVVDVDALTVRFQRAIDIIEDLDGRIRRARAKIDELSPRLDAIASTRVRPDSDSEPDDERAP